MAVSDGIAEAAEDLFVHVRWMSGLRRERLGGVELCLWPGAGPVFAKVGRVRRRSDELDEALDGVRARLRSEGRTTSTWSLGPSTTPSGVEQRLLGLGLVPFASTTGDGGDRCAGRGSGWCGGAAGSQRGTAASVYLDGCVGLIGGSTLPEARGRGVYRALVRARWEDAVARDLPALVTQAVNSTSKPILEHLGFVPLFPIPILRDTHP
jgi:GNAT superfamily N-acetyltransferase